MLTSFRKKQSKGFTIIEVIIVVAIMGLVFAGLFAGFEYSLKLIAHTRAKMTALSLATDRSEYIRSLPYDAVGTVAGLPSGTIPQNRVVTLNGINFAERVLIENVDDPADGVGAADSNSVLADYKRFKIEYSWTVYDSAQSFSLVSTVTPRSIETSGGGGTLRVNVFDAAVTPLPGASVRLVNTTGTTTVDVTRMTDATGAALFTGAPATSGYEVFVTGPGYSSDQTNPVTIGLPFPAVQPFAILEADVSTVNFQIDRLSDLTLNVFSGETITDSTEDFVDLFGAFATSSVEATSSVLRLENTAGVYASAGTVMLDPVAPATNESWGVIEIDKIEPVGTEARVRVYASTTPTSLIPDSDLPGNAAGFLSEKINISSLDIALYPELVLGIELSTVNTARTPEIDSITVYYSSARTMLASNDLYMRGSKVVGMDGFSQNVYKFETSTSTNALGQLVLEDIEWDTYFVELGDGYDVAEACTALPYYLAPDSERILNIYAEMGGSDNLRILAKDAAGNPIAGATVELDNMSGTVRTEETGWCGQAFFGSVNTLPEYELRVGADGFATTTVASTTVSGVTYQEVVLNP